jgi:hypothetical protein
MRTPAAPLPQGDQRFLILAAIVLVALGLAFKSELIATGQVWDLSVVLLVVALPAVFIYLRAESGLPPIEHYVPAAIGSVVVGGLAALIPQWWAYGLVVLTFGASFYAATILDRRRLRDRLKPGHVIVQETVLGLSLAAGYLVVLSVQFTLPIKLMWVFVLTLLATYRAFRLLGRAMSPRRAILFSLLVAQVVIFLAAGLSEYTPVTGGVEAVMLFLAWYINRGLVQHTVDETLTRQVALEYFAFGGFLTYLFIASSQAH